MFNRENDFMKMNITLTTALGINGYVMAVIFTRDTMDQNIMPVLDTSNLAQTSNLVYVSATPGASLSGLQYYYGPTPPAGVQLVLPTPAVLPVANYYGFIIGYSPTGDLSLVDKTTGLQDFFPMFGVITHKSVCNDNFASMQLSQFPYYDIHGTFIGYDFLTQPVAGFKMSWS